MIVELVMVSNVIYLYRDIYIIATDSLFFTKDAVFDMRIMHYCYIFTDKNGATLLLT